MTYCDQMSDRMPAVVAGRARWSTVEARHLADCGECRLEWELVRSAARLGSGIDLQVKESALAEAVLRRVHPDAAPTARRRVWAFGGLTAAASVGMLIWGKVSPTHSPGATVQRESTVAASANPNRLALPVPELDGLRTEELDTLLQSLDRPFRADDLLESRWGDEGGEFVRGFSTSEG